MAHPPLHLPPAPLRLQPPQPGQQHPRFWCVLRRRWLLLGPEEWVRQHLLHYLMGHLHYPPALLRLEGPHHLHQRHRRSDLLAYSRQGSPLLLAECKRAEHPLNQAHLQQLGTYNQQVQAPHLVLTNGLQLWAASRQPDGSYLPGAIPAFGGE